MSEHVTAAGHRRAPSGPPSFRPSRTGDDGTTDLQGVGRVSKADPRLVAAGACDEASAAIGLTIALGAGLPDPVLIALVTVQNDLLDLGADVSTPTSSDGSGVGPDRIGDDYVGRVQRACDHFDDDLEVLPSWVMPGGTAPAALLHHARTVVRRAEQAVWAAVAEHGDTMNPATGRYLNRLSALLFILARSANLEHGDTLWADMLTPSRSDGELWEMPPAP